MNKLRSLAPPWWLLQFLPPGSRFLPRVLTLTSLNDWLWYGNLSQRKSLLPKLLLAKGFIKAIENNHKTRCLLPKWHRLISLSLLHSLNSHKLLSLVRKRKSENETSLTSGPAFFHIYGYLRTLQRDLHLIPWFGAELKLALVFGLRSGNPSTRAMRVLRMWIMVPCRLLAGHHFVWFTIIFSFQQNSNNHSTITKSIGGLLAAQIKVLFNFVMTHVEIFILS